ncbi:unnamed protein product [Brachionus calyciflorus]|uniref:RNA-directed DNA polymerase from mobile element jockey-like n=1 Tax=Brachionus calyciflorus TaxID=104777 RepID=A0A813YXB6_9BILA|nr:unnamed protein product [Brachionus calyciflorus]
MEYNKLTSKLRKNIDEFKNNSWKKFIESLRKSPISSVQFWRRINKFKKKSSAKAFPRLTKDGIEYNTDAEKSNLFGMLLEKTFTLNDMTDKKTVGVMTKVNEFKESPIENNIELITISELINAIKKSTERSSAGLDKKTNIMLKNLPLKALKEILSLFNLSLLQSKVPKNWKIASITMIPKKEGMTNDPASYRPISVTSCLGKNYGKNNRK